jgi:hypothetical protein
VCHDRRVDRFIRAVLEGDDAAPGRIAAADVARLLLGMQSVLRRAAHVVLGRPRPTLTGRYGKAIEDATRLRLVRVEAGSFASVLALPDISTDADDLGLDGTVHDLGYRAFDHLLNVLQVSEPGIDPGLARAIGQLAEDVNVGSRVSLIRLETLAAEGRVAVIDGSTRRAMELAASQPERRPDTVYGRLVEADFENNKARLRQPTGEAVTVTFDESLADDIQAALREPSVFVGDIIYNRPTGLDIRIALDHVVGPDEQLALSGLHFHGHRTVAELAIEQGVHAPQNLDNLRASGIDADELAAFVAAAEQL